SSAAAGRSMPMRRIRSPCCARATSGQAAAAPLRSVMNSRRRIAAPEAQDGASYQPIQVVWKGQADVRFGSKADICSAIVHVRYGPKATLYPTEILGLLHPRLAQAFNEFRHPAGV